MPSLSVIIPVHNAEPYLDACLKSLCQSNYPRLEICIIDDGSTDGSARRLQHWRDRDPRIRVRQQSRKGAVATRNALIEMAEGEILVLQDADDISHRDRLERIADSYMAERWDMLHSRAFLVNLGGEIKAASFLLRPFAFFLRSGHCTIIHGSAAVRRDLLVRLGGYREVAAEDLDLWIRLLTAGSHIHFLPQPLYARRMYAESVTGRRTLRLMESSQELRHHRSIIGFPRDIVAYYKLKLAVTYQDEAIAKVLRYNPLWACRLFLTRALGRMLARRYRAWASGFNEVVWGL